MQMLVPSGQVPKGKDWLLSRGALQVLLAEGCRVQLVQWRLPAPGHTGPERAGRETVIVASLVSMPIST